MQSLKRKKIKRRTKNSSSLFYFLPMKLPTKEQALDYFDEYLIPQNIKEHCLVVRNLANFLAKKLIEGGESLDLELVDCASLLHDLFKFFTLKKLEPNKFFNNKFSLEQQNKWKEMKEKYPQKYEGDIAFDIFGEKYPDLAQSLFVLGNPYQEVQTKENLLIHYCDWLVIQDKIVTMEERLAYLNQMYLPNVWSNDYPQMKEYEKKLMKKIDLKPGQISAELIKENG